MKPTFDSDSVHPDDPMLALGGSPAAVRHDPYEGIDPTLPENEGWVGHADCAANWDACQCHGDRLCRLGMAMRTMMQTASHTAWLQTPEGARPGQYRWEQAHAIHSGQRLVRDFERDIWPMITANARQAREQGVLLG